MNWRYSVHCCATALALVMSGCSDSGSGPEEPGVRASQQASTADKPGDPDTVVIAKAEEAKAPESTFDDNPYSGSYSDLPEPTAKQDRCPGDKLKRKDWEALREAKEAHAAARAAKAANETPPVSAPSQDLLTRQQRFVEAVAARKAQLSAMSPEDREREYQDLKQQMIGE